MMVIIRVHRVIPRQTTALASIIWSKAVASVVVHRSITIMRSIVLQLWRMGHGIAFLIGRYVGFMTAPIIKTYILGKSISNIFILLVSSSVSSKSALCWVMILRAVVALDSALRRLIHTASIRLWPFIVLWSKRGATELDTTAPVRAWTTFRVRLARAVWITAIFFAAAVLVARARFSSISTRSLALPLAKCSFKLVNKHLIKLASFLTLLLLVSLPAFS